jgi:uncharacterized membrane protein YfcA
MEYLFLLFLFIIAFLYSSVGHGGASGYLALMALYGVLPDIMRPTALLLNVFVSLIAFFSYTKAGYFRAKLIIPFLITSVPAAFAGGLIHSSPSVYKIVLGIFLLLATARMLFVKSSITEASKQPILVVSLLIGALLGFFSGMIGIGGGIILSPLLLLMHWANMKEAAAASALFIFLNSLSGLFALMHGGFSFSSHIITWVLVGVLGGIAGAFSGSFKIHSEKLKYILAGVLVLASFKLILF